MLDEELLKSTTTEEYYENSLDQMIAPGLRLWMLLAMIFGVLLFMTIVVCCFMKIRIPRTKREIELMAAKRRLRKQRGAIPAQDVRAELHLEHKERKGQVIVMQSLGVPPNFLQPPGSTPLELAECASSCGACSQCEAFRSRSCSTSKNSPPKGQSPLPSPSKGGSPRASPIPKGSSPRSSPKVASPRASPCPNSLSPLQTPKKGVSPRDSPAKGRSPVRAIIVGNQEEIEMEDDIPATAKLLSHQTQV